jgi:6-phosphogluconolactonase (cycloisomerase 2 family)
VLYGFPQAALINTSVAATINLNTGGFSSISIGTGPFGTSGMAAVNAQFLYVSFGDPQLFGYSISPTNGALTALAGSPFSFPSGTVLSGLAAAPNGQFLYAAEATGHIDVFSVDSATGVPTAITGSPFASGNNFQLVVDPSGKFLYASDDNPPGGILAFTIAPSGALTPVSGSPFAIPGQTVANSEPYGIVSAGSFVYATLSAADQIAAFSIDSGTGALTSVPGSPFSAGDDPAVLTVTNNFLYAVNWTDGSISGCSINASSGALTPAPGSPFGSDGATLAADPSGEYPYVSTSLGIVGWDINSTTGALTPGAATVSNDGSLWLTFVQLPSSVAQ